MTGVAVQIRTDDKDYRETAARLCAVMSDLTEPMDEIGSMMEASTVHRFETETDPEGIPWTPSERALLTGGQTLTDEAFLRGSITHFAGRDRAETGSNLVYAGIQHGGGRAGRNLSVELPARGFVGADDNDEAEIARILEDYIGGAIQ